MEHGSDIAAVLDGRSPGLVIHAKAEAALPTLPDCCIDAVVTDPPAGIAFMGKSWDANKGGRDKWIAWMAGIAAECLRVLKPGGHALVWAIPRTSHLTATAWEDAGFAVRDRISHLFGSGFPKSLDVGKAIDKAAGAEREVVGTYSSHRPNTAVHKNLKYAGELHTSGVITSPTTDAARQWDGWGTALKPACEDWWLLRKPLGEPTVAANVLKHGTGGINVDACRIGFEGDDGQWHSTPGRGTEGRPARGQTTCFGKYGDSGDPKDGIRYESKGRFPANITHDGSEEVLAGFPETKSGLLKAGTIFNGGNHVFNLGFDKAGRVQQTSCGDDSGSAARFFYCAKASRSDRGAVNKHPTVKNTALMEWLVRLITPPGGVVLDCFAGSGSTLIACMRLGCRFVGIEQEAEYCATLRARLSAGPLYGEWEGS